MKRKDENKNLLIDEMLSSTQLSRCVSVLRDKINSQKCGLHNSYAIDLKELKNAEKELRQVKNAYISALKQLNRQDKNAFSGVITGFSNDFSKGGRVNHKYQGFSPPLNYSRPKSSEELTNHFSAWGLRSCAPQIKSCLI